VDQSNEKGLGMKDAQQQIIQELRAALARIQSGGCARDQSTTQFCAEAVEVGEKLGAMRMHVERCRQIVKCPDDETLAEWLKGFVRLDDPVVTGLVEALKNSVKWESGQSVQQALSAYEARVKSIQEP
jgi:hypothetical protein